MILTREKGKRMWGGLFSETSGSGGGEGGSGGVTPAWIDSTYLSKEFFNQLFVVHINTKVTVTDGMTTTETNTPGVMSPNDVIPEDVVEQDVPSAGYTTTTHVSIESIEAKSNFWSSLAISALGQGSGGGGGAVALADLVDVAISNPTNGQVLMYNSTTNKWYNGTVQSGGGSVTSITAGTGLSGGTITSSGTIAISSTYQSYISHGETAYRWTQNFGATDVNTALGFTITGTAGTTYNLGNFLTGITSTMINTALGFTPLSNQTTFWGQTPSNGVVSGNMTNVGSIDMKGLINGVQAIEMNNDSTTHGTGHGGYIDFHYNASSADYTSRLIESAENILKIQAKNSSGQSKYAALMVGENFDGSYLQIGNVRLVYESNNNALKVTDNNGNAANFYALGAVSALGFSSGSGSTAIDNLTVNSSVKMEDYSGSSLNVLSVTKATSATTVNYLNIGEAWSALYHDTRIYGYNVQLVSGNGAYITSMNGSGKVTFPNYIQASRFYLDSSRYIYLSGSSLYYYNGSTSIQIA